MRVLQDHGITCAIWAAIIALMYVAYAPTEADDIIPKLPNCLEIPTLKRYFDPLVDVPSAESCRTEAGWSQKIQLSALLSPSQEQVASFFNSEACKTYFTFLLDVYVNKLPPCLLQINETYSVENKKFASLSYEGLKTLYQSYELNSN